MQCFIGSTSFWTVMFKCLVVKGVSQSLFRICLGLLESVKGHMCFALLSLCCYSLVCLLSRLVVLIGVEWTCFV